jgi:transposase
VGGGGCNGIGKHIAHRLVHDGETVLDVPVKRSAQVRVFATGNGRKSDPVDAHSVAMVALRTLIWSRSASTLTWWSWACSSTAATSSGAPAPRRSIGCTGCCWSCSLAEPNSSCRRARRARWSRRSTPDIVGKTRRRLAVELIGELERIDRKTKAADKDLKEPVTARGSTLMDLRGIGPSGATRLLADVGNVRRFADRDRFASWNGTAPLDASCGQQQRHRLSRAGNRRINRVLHVMAIVQPRNPTEGRAYFDAKKAAGKPRWRPRAPRDDNCPTWSLPAWWKTLNAGRWRAWKGTRGRLCNPA